jgi:hypothetical protein
MPVISSTLIEGSTKANQIDDKVMDLAEAVLQFFATSGLSTDTTVSAALASVVSGYFDEIRVVGADAKNGLRIHNSTGTFQVRIRTVADYSGHGLGPADAVVIEYAAAASSGDMNTPPTFAEWMVIMAGTIYHVAIGDILAAISNASGGGISSAVVNPDYQSGLAVNISSGVLALSHPAPAAVGAIPYAAQANGLWAYMTPSASGAIPIWDAGSGQWTVTTPSLFTHGQFGGTPLGAGGTATLNATTPRTMTLQYYSGVRGTMPILSGGAGLDVVVTGNYLISAHFRYRVQQGQANYPACTKYAVRGDILVGGTVEATGIQKIASPYLASITTNTLVTVVQGPPVTATAVSTSTPTYDTENSLYGIIPVHYIGEITDAQNISFQMLLHNSGGGAEECIMDVLSVDACVIMLSGT